MKKAKIYIPVKTAMQSGRGKQKKWVLEFETKDQAINFAKKNSLDYYLIEPQKRKLIKKSYTDNFLKD